MAIWRRLLAVLAVLAPGVLSLPAGAAARAPGAVAPPPGCTPVVLAQAAASAGPICVHRALVLRTVNAHEQNVTTFVLADPSRHRLTATVPNWWPSGPPTAGMVVTVWGHMQGGVLAADRWIDLTHSMRPAPAGPYPLVSALDVSSGRVPEHRMVWVPVIAFLLDPQDGGDGDIHVQTFSACPTAGLTTENTPPLRGYVDHPAVPGLTSSSDTADAPHDHLGDAPPVGVPVLVLGATRYDYGMGWWEIHPIRAWRPLTAAEAAAQGRQCAGAPVPMLDSGPTLAGHALPVPFGVPACTDGSEFGNPPGFAPCRPRCYVAATSIGRLEQLSGPCAGIAPRLTPSQWRRPEHDPGSGTGALLGPEPPAPSPLGEQETADAVPVDAAMLRAYGPLCLDRLQAMTPGEEATCALALAHLASGETLTPAAACRQEPPAAALLDPRAACEAAGEGLVRQLAIRRTAGP